MGGLAAHKDAAEGSGADVTQRAAALKTAFICWVMYTRAREEQRGFSGVQPREACMTHEHVKCATRRRRFVEYISEYEASC
eukprot:5869216-Pleurochrysis_carterae.AAC.1